MPLPAYIIATANIICRHGSHILLLKRSENAGVWPNYWCLPGGKVDEGELPRQAGLRELEEEVGISCTESQLDRECVVMYRSVEGMRAGYFAMVTDYRGAPENLEPHLATDLAWFSIDELPSPMIPNHRVGLEAILAETGYVEYDELG